MSFAKMIIVGNLGKDPELRYMPDGRPVSSFSLCANERRRSGEDVQNWFNVNVYGNSADAVSQHLKKGDPVYIEGRLKSELWKGRDGEVRLTNNINTTDVQFLGKGRRSREDASAAAAEAATGEEVPTGGELSDDDVPF